MKLATLTVSFPMFLIESSVQHQSPRLSTVFERMVLRLCSHSRSHPELMRMTLLDVFQQRLGVSNAQALVEPCLEDMMILGILENSRSQEQMLIPLESLKLTELGHDFWLRKQLPGRTKNNTVKHLYDPLTDKLIWLDESSQKKRLPQQPSDTRFEVEDFILENFSARVEDNLSGEKHEWLKNNTEINSVQSRVIETVWRNYEIQVDCDQSGRLSLSAHNSDLQSWLVAGDVELIWQRLLSTLLSVPTNSTNETTFRSVDIHSAQSIFPIIDDGDLNAGILHTGQIVLQVTCGEMIPLKTPATRWFHLRQNITEVKWSIEDSSLNDSDNPLATFPRPDALPDSFLGLTLSRAGATPSAITRGIATLYWAGQARNALVAITHNESASLAMWTSIRSVLEPSLYAHQNPAIAAIPTLWENFEVVIRQWFARMNYQPLSQLLANAQLLHQGLSGCLGSSVPKWEGVWQQLLTEAVQHAMGHLSKPISQTELLELLKALKASSVQGIDNIQLELLKQSSPISDIESLKLLRETLEGKPELPYSIFSVLGRRVLLEHSLLSVSKPNFFAPHPYVHNLEQIRRAYDALVKEMGDDLLKGVSTSSSAWLATMRKISTSTLQNIKNWHKAADDLRVMFSDEQIWTETQFEKLDHKVMGWQKYINQFLLPPLSDNRKAVVFDTNTLMNFPDIFERMLPSDQAVIPKRVLEELDGIKQDKTEDRSIKAQQAIKALERAKESIRYEGADIQLLPDDWEDNSDNRILSVALRFRMSRVMLLTSDINLHNKARAEGLEVQKPDDYLKTKDTNKKTQSNKKR